MYPNSTPVPNCLFDDVLTRLKPAELKVLLVIIRQTYGWIDNKNPKQRKQRDWISQSQFQSKTGLSRKAVSTALGTLVKRKFVNVSDFNGQAVNTSGKARKFYAFAVPNGNILSTKRVNSTHEHGNFLPPTKENITKETLQQFQKEMQMAGGFDQLMVLKGVVRME